MPPRRHDRRRPQPTDALTWWHGLTDAERNTWSDQVGRVVDLGLGPQPRPERAIAEAAFAERMARLK